MKNKLINFIETHQLNKKKILLAVSGGIDSIVLFHLLNSVKNQFEISIAVCHVDHMLRKESVTEQTFVGKLCKKKKVEFFKSQVNVPDYMQKNNVSLEMAAHECRYQHLIQLKKKSESDYIMTAHHFDDQIETIFMRFGFGAGIEGIQGLADKNGFFLKPLLKVKKANIEEYASSHRLEYQTDLSNNDNSINRNYWRNKILPKIEERFGQVYFEKLIHTIENMNWTARDYDLLDKIVKSYRLKKNRLNIPKPNLTVYPNAFLKLIVESLLNEHFNQSVILSKIQFSSFLELLTKKESGKQLQLDSIIIETSFKDILIYKRSDLNKSELYQIYQGQMQEFADFSLRVSLVDAAAYKNSKSIEYASADQLFFPLKLRKIKTGETFQPLGMKGKQKINRHLKAKNIDQLSRQDSWVLCDNDNIIWLIGHQLDARYAVKKETKNILKMEIIQAD